MDPRPGEGVPLPAEAHGPRAGGPGGGPEGPGLAELHGDEEAPPHDHLRHHGPPHVPPGGRKSKARSRNDTYVGPLVP